MTKFRKIIKFIKKHRANGVASFDVVTNSDTFILSADYKEKGAKYKTREQLRLPYK